MASELPAQSYLAKLANKSALAAITGLVSTNPIVKMFASNFVPLLTARHKNKNPVS